MPTYVYEHSGKGCALGKVFETEQSMRDDAFEACPKCRKKVARLLCAPSLSFPRTNSELKGMGFSKLVRRDKGVYENVSALEGEKKIVNLADKSTYPDLKRHTGGD